MSKKKNVYNFPPFFHNRVGLNFYKYIIFIMEILLLFGILNNFFYNIGTICINNLYKISDYYLYFRIYYNMYGDKHNVSV